MARGVELLVLGLLGIVALSCGPIQNQRPRVTVGVEHFAVEDPTATDDDAHFGSDAAALLASMLRGAGADAYLVPIGGAPYGDVRITGGVSLLDRGSRTARCLVGFGAGRVHVGVVVTARDSTGQQLAQVAADRSAHLCDIGDGELDRALRAVTNDLVNDPQLRHVVFAAPVTRQRSGQAQDNNGGR